IIKSIEYFQSNQGSFLLNKINMEAEELIACIKELNIKIRLEITGALRRKMPIIDKIELIANEPILHLPEKFITSTHSNSVITGMWKEFFKTEIHISDNNKFANTLFETTGGSEEFTEFMNMDGAIEFNEEKEIFEYYNKNYIPAECRDMKNYISFDEKLLIEESDIKGVIHNHSTYSDGVYDLKSMSRECIRLGYSYLVISDHSKTAGYANGLSIERVEMQWREIDDLNKELTPFKIFKSIESDILSDGSLDYPADILSGFDLVIASIHSNLKMDQEKAMMRLINAIENPFTTILGHITGRLLLSRRGYPVDHERLIDCCALHGVSIELNANPVRLDMDWTWIPYAENKGVLISINPDAHNLKGIQDIKFGVAAARKGGLTKVNCLNAKSLEEFESYINVKKNAFIKH
ncbi:MAG: PHP domain-containing protein, partial [Saprospiraceae bacterium]